MKKFSKNLLTLLAISLFLRIALSFFGTYQLDQNTFIYWANLLKNQGFQGFYSNTWSDYLPGYLYILRILANFEVLKIIPNVVLYKLPAIFADLVTITIIYFAVRKKFSEKTSIITAALFSFNPAIIGNSTIWGQVDIFSSLFPLLSIFFINSIFSPIFLAFGGLMKPQSAMAIPVIIAIMLQERWRFKKMVKYFSILLIVFLLGFLVFSDEPNLISFILDRVGTTLNQYKYGSVNAFNFWGLFGFWKPDDVGVFSSKNIGSISLILISFITFLKLLRNKNQRYFALAILLLANFLFMTRMHERHMLPALAPLVIASAGNIFLLALYGVLSAIYVFNLYYAYAYIGQNHTQFFPSEFVVLLIVVNLVTFAILFFLFIKSKNIKISLDKFSVSKFFERKKIKHEKFKDLVTQKKSKYILILILLFSLITRLINLGYPPEDYFDEIYHRFTARQMLAGDPKPWHWSSEHPEGFAYEWTHPPLAKEIMAGSMGIFGVNAFAARLPGVLLGVGIIFLTFKLAFYFTKSRDLSLAAAVIVATDGLMFTMSRIATADIYYLFFALATLLFFLNKKYFFASIFFGLALASKWSAIYLLPILTISFIAQRRKINIKLIYFLIFPIAIYIASYIPMFAFGYDFETFIGMQKQMWWYHSGLVATHPYTSAWWGWPLNLRPVYFYQFDDGVSLGNIYAMGNPFFFWFGLVSVVYALYKLITKKASKYLAIILFGYLIFFAPWAASPRIMFIYHYLPSLPFLAILLAYAIKKNQKLLIPVLIILAGSFIYFYPHWTGMHIPPEISKSYYWLKSWR